MHTSGLPGIFGLAMYQCTYHHYFGILLVETGMKRPIDGGGQLKMYKRMRVDVFKGEGKALLAALWPGT
ncbi:MAG TPA: hypothetical protein VNI77_00200 [Nitrososphaera sp.]|nr:hypothetical protein [Nitrososphaera sp.]